MTASLRPFRKPARRAAADDVVTVYYSGHGAMTPTTPVRRYLVPHDRPWLGGEKFIELLKAIPAQRLLVLLDCCYAGGIRAEPGVKAAGVKSVPVPFDLTASPASRGFRNGGDQLIPGRRVSEIGEPYSIFTQVLIEALCGARVSGQDGYVRVTDLFSHLAEWVPRLTGERQHPVLDLAVADNYRVAHYAAGRGSRSAAARPGRCPRPGFGPAPVSPRRGRAGLPRGRRARPRRGRPGRAAGGEPGRATADGDDRRRCDSGAAENPVQQYLRQGRSDPDRPGE